MFEMRKERAERRGTNKDSWLDTLDKQPTREWTRDMRPTKRRWRMENEESQI